MQGETSRAEKKKPKTTKTAFPLNVKLAAKESQSPQIPLLNVQLNSTENYV